MSTSDIPASAIRTIEEEREMVHAAVGRGGTLPSSSEAMSEAMSGVESSLVLKVILAVLGCLLLLNVFMHYKLSSLERAANMSVLSPPTIRFAGEAPQSQQEWLMLLEEQESLHISEINNWHEVLIKILHQAEKDLASLRSHICINVWQRRQSDRNGWNDRDFANLTKHIKREEFKINTTKNSDSNDASDVTRE